MIVAVIDGPMVVVGAGGHGREAVAIARAVRCSLVGVLDDGTPDLPALAALGVGHLGGVDWLRTTEVPHFYVAALGYPAPRRDVASRADEAGGVAATLVHPSASIGPDVRMGPGTLVWSQVGVTVTARLGRHTHLNVGSSVSHDVELGDFVTLGPGARVCGAAVLEDDVWIGAGAIVIQNVRIGRGAVVGAGAVVLRDIEANQVVAGVPARPINPSRLSGPDTQLR